MKISINTEAPILAFEDSRSIESTKSQVYNSIFPALEKLVIEFNALEIGEVLTSDLRGLVENPETIVNKKCLGKIESVPTHGGFPVKKEKLLDQLELPDMSLVKNAATATLKALGSRGFFYLSFYEVTSSGLEVNEDALQAYLEGSRTYAVSEHEKAVLGDYNGFVNAYKKMDATLKSSPRTPGGLDGISLNTLFSRNEQGEVVINPMAYSQFVSAR